MPTAPGTAFPIVQAPMAGVQGSALAIAVSNAGGLGSLPCAALGIEGMRAELAAIREGTDRPFNVNFFCHSEPAPDPGLERAWQTRLAPYYREYGLEVPESGGPGRSAFDAAMVEALAPFAPPVVSFHFGLPAASLIARVKGWGATVVSSATTVDEAIWLERHGADVVIAQGLEAGGHRGMFLTEDVTTQIGTLELVQQVVAAVRIPVWAAGGIASAAAVRAALALGAAAAQVGTAYLLCPEANSSPVHRAALEGPGAAHTALTNLFTGRPARAIVNRVMRELEPLRPDVPAFPRAIGAMAPLRLRAEAEGSDDFSPLWAGQGASTCRALPAAEITRALAGGVP